MKTFQYVMASSVFFGSTTPAFSTSAAATTAQFGPGATGGPVKVDYYQGYSMQANFGGNGNPSSGTYGGLFNVLVSNVPETPLFVTAASALVQSTGSVMFDSNSQSANYRFIDFQFVPSSASTSGFVSVYLRAKA